MTLEIQLVDHTKVVNPATDKGTLITGDSCRITMTKDQQTWIIPEVVLAPSDQLPHLQHVVVTVTGTPQFVAERIQAKLKIDHEYNPLKQIGQRNSFGNHRVEDAGPLPADSYCELTVVAHYLDSDRLGKPAGAPKIVTRKCKLYSDKLPDMPTEMVIRPPTLPLTSGVGSTLTIEVRAPKTEATPVMQLRYPDTVLAPNDPVQKKLEAIVPDLTAALQQALHVSFARQESVAKVRTYDGALVVKLKDHTRNEIAKVEEPILVPVVVSLNVTPMPPAKLPAGAKPPEDVWLRKMFFIKLEAAIQQFLGWVVIDFGTTNSTVTVHEKRVSEPIEGLPIEQEIVLRAQVCALLSKSGQELFPGLRKYDAPWRDLLGKVATGMGLGSSDGLATKLASGSLALFYESLAYFEVALLKESGDFSQHVFGKLHKIYHDALRVPAYSREFIYPVLLDQTRRQETVESEMEIVAVKRTDQRDQTISLHMGKEVADTKLQKIFEESDDLDDVLSRFVPSPKRYFGTDRQPFTVKIDGQTHHVSVDQLMRAGWEELLNMTNRAREHDTQFGPGPFRRVVVTYPTVAPPSVRQKIPLLLKDLKLTDVRTDYDEAVAAAIFYMFREYGGCRELGLESFKARSSKRGENWWAQNVLVFDIGGGTTDVALIRLTLTEETVFGPGDDRGAAGRYYKITPKLLSSTGNTRLGGEIMTLRVFRLLKLILADRVLTLTQQDKLRCEPAKNLLAKEMPEEVKDRKDAKNTYEPGWLVRAIDQEKPERGDRPKFERALDLADKVIRTRWAGETPDRQGRLQAFYTLWGYAEKAKRELGGKPSEGNERPELFQLKADQVIDFLNQCYPDGEVQPIEATKDKDLRIDLRREQVDTAVRSIVESAANYAVGAVKQLEKDEKVDWLILSGQSCHLALVDELIREKFSKTDRFIWNPERVTFVPRYAKLATSMGACFAENQRRGVQKATQMKDVLRKGENVLHFEIDNLFHFLPCSFKYILPGTSRNVFTVGTELLEIDEQPAGQERGKARSEWFGAALDASLSRSDFEESPPIPWGAFDGQAIVNELGLDAKVWRDKYQVAFEIDHRLTLDVLVYQCPAGARAPHYLFTAREPLVNLREIMERLNAPAKAPADAAAKPAPAPPALPPLFADVDGKKMLSWTIGVENPLTGDQITLFNPEDKKQTADTFHFATGDKIIRAWQSSARVCQEGGLTQLKVWGKPPKSNTTYPLRILEMPTGEPKFRRLCRLTLDEEGVLRIHPGEPCFWESSDMKVLKNQPGRVFRTHLELKPQDADEEANPFSGLH